MEGILKVTPQDLKSTASQFSQSGNSVQTLTNQMLEMVKGLGTNWQGQAASGYINKFTKLSDDIQKMNRMIQEHVKDLEAMAQQYEQAEKANQEISQGLADNIIS